jgi:hypothetical protein
MSLLPKGYQMPEAPKSNFDGVSLFTKLKPGANKMRIISEAQIGYVWWNNKKPMRCRRIDEVPSNIPQGGMSGYKEFWAFKVYNHTEGSIQLMEITQQSIKSAIYDLDNSEDWGDVHLYDITIQKNGEGKETEYNVIPSPSKPLPEKALEGDEKIDIDWTKYFAGESPFVIKGTVKTGKQEVADVSEAQVDGEGKKYPF